MILALYFGSLAGVLLFTIFIHLQIASKTGWSREEVLFLGNSLMALVYMAITWFQYNTTDLRFYLALNLAQSVSWTIFFLCLAELLSGGRGRRIALRAWEAAFVAFTVVCGFFPYGGAYVNVHGMKPVDLPWGDRVMIIDGDGTPVYAIMFVLILGGLAFASPWTLRRARAKEGREERALLISVGILLAAIIFDILVALNVVRWCYLSETAYVAFVVLTGFSITERVIRVAALETALKRSLAEKDILIKEIHHRVRNNLAVLSSLVRLQFSAEPDNVAKLRLGTTLGRIRSIAGVHDLAYDPLGKAEVELQSYLDGVFRAVRDTFGDDHVELASRVEPRGLMVPVDLAVPLGLMANEIFSNSVLHAWKDGRQGVRRVNWDARLEGEGLRIGIGDNGGGRDDGGKAGLGTRLIRVLADQIEADVEEASRGGTSWTISLDIGAQRVPARIEI